MSHLWERAPVMAQETKPHTSVLPFHQRGNKILEDEEREREENVRREGKITNKKED